VRVAAIDVGSNSVKLAIGDVEGDHVHVVSTDRITLQLGRDVELHGRLGNAVIDAVADAVGSLATQARMAGARRIDVVGTSAAREASDGDRLVAAVGAAAGVPMRRLSGLDEAHLVSRSIDIAVGIPLRSAIMLDIGGGSTELVHTDGGLVVDQVSLPIGAVRLTDRLELRGEEPFDDNAKERLRGAIDEAINDVGSVESGSRGFGCGGTVTSLARLHLFGMPPSEGRASAVDRALLSRDGVDELLDGLASKSLAHRMACTGLKAKRAQIIPAGAAILAGLLHRLDVENLQVHEQGIRTGLLFDLAQR